VLTTGVLLLALGTVPVLIPLLATQEPEPTRAPVPSGRPGSAVPSGQTAALQPGAAADGMASGVTSPTRTPARTSPGPTPAPTSTPAPAGLDLVVTGIGWLPAEPRAGYAVTFRATVRNVGTEATPAAGPSILFQVDGVTVSWSRSDTVPMQPGEQRTYTADGGPTASTWLATNGRHTVTAVVDPAGQIREAAESNNTGTAALTVPGGGPGR